jgi:hypothetical protein
LTAHAVQILHICHRKWRRKRREKGKRRKKKGRGEEGFFRIPFMNKVLKLHITV